MTSNSLNVQSLVTAENYRDFIAAFMASKSSKRRLSYTMIAKRGGFSSRSFPRDVVTGRRNLTRTSLPKMMRGLGLSDALAQYFELLVQLEHPECSDKPVSRKSLVARLAHLRSRLKPTTDAPARKAIEKYAFFSGRLPAIFAALGTNDKGATIDEIVARTGYTKLEIEHELEQMIQCRITMQDGPQFRPLVSHLELAGLHNDFFANYLRFNLKRADQIVGSPQLKSNQNLFVTSAVSINRRNLPKIKEALRAHINAFLEQIEEPEGDYIASTTVAFF